MEFNIRLWTDIFDPLGTEFVMFLGRTLSCSINCGIPEFGLPEYILYIIISVGILFVTKRLFLFIKQASNKI